MNHLEELTKICGMAEERGLGFEFELFFTKDITFNYVLFKQKVIFLEGLREYRHMDMGKNLNELKKEIKVIVDKLEGLRV